MPRAAPTALAKADADEQRADQPRPLRHGDGVDVVPGRAGLLERALDDAADVAQVLARCEFGHDASPLAVNRDLRRDDAREHPPTAAFGSRHDGGGGLVAAALDAEDAHQRTPASTGASPASAKATADRSKSACRDSVYGARATPRSVMMPAIRRCGVTSNAGL